MIRNKTYPDEIRRLQAENAKLIYKMKLRYLYDDEDISRQFKESKNYNKNNLIMFNRLLHAKIRMLQSIKEQENKQMIFDERSLDEIISSYTDKPKEPEPSIVGRKKKQGQVDFTKSYQEYRRLKRNQQNVEVRPENHLLEELNKLLNANN